MIKKLPVSDNEGDSTMHYYQNSIETFTVRARQPLKATYGGNSSWSSSDLAGRKTEVRKIDLFLCNLGERCGRQELYVGIHAFIPKRMWDTSKYGLIYTDDRWEREFRAGMKQAFPVLKSVQGVIYTEQGQQGPDYVSLSGVIYGEKKIQDFANAIEAGDILYDMIFERSKNEERGFE